MRKNHTKLGKLTNNGVRLEVHERKTVDFFLSRGDDVELLVPSNTAGNKNADWLLWGKVWEAKSPKSNNANTLLVCLKRASKQSANLIVDLRRVKSHEQEIIKLVRAKFMTSKRFKHLLIITKNGKLMEFKKH